MFRWHVSHDIDLLREVVAVRPKSSNDWNSIAANLQKAWGDVFTSPIKGRSCKEHFEVLLAHHKAGNASALKKSGTEEQYGEIHQLLDDVLAFLTDMRQEQKSCKRRLNEDMDKQKAEMFRDAAMTSMKKKCSSSVTASDSDEETDTVDSIGASKKAKRQQRAKRPDVMMYLAEKRESDIVLRQRDLEYKNKALEAETKLKEDALALERKKLELQEKQINMQFEMLRAFLSSSTKQNN